MNCKPGDLARVVISGPLQDKLIVVTDWVDLGYGPEWFYEGSRLPAPGGNEYVAIFDRVLRPIRDPGDDARDEMLRPLPIDEPLTA